MNWEEYMVNRFPNTPPPPYSRINFQDEEIHNFILYIYAFLIF